MSSGASDYQPDSSTPAKSHRELGNMPKQRRKKASQKAAALVSDPDYATTSTSKVPRINKKPDSGTKPSYSYAALIGQAILNSQNKLLSLNDIYCFIMVNYTFFKKDVAGWQNSIRHNLSLNDSFLKVARGPENPGKGSLWTIKPGDEDLFVNGGYVKRAALSKSRAGSNASSTGRPERSSTQQGRSSSPELTLESPSPTKLDPPAQLEVKPQLSRHSSYRSARATSVKEESVEPEQEASRSPTPEPFAQVVVQEPSAQSQRPADIYEGDQEPDDSGVELQTNAPQNELEPVKIAHSTLEVVASRASRQSSPCDSISDPSEPTKPHTSTSQSIGGLGEPVSLDMMSKRPAVHEDEDAAESSTGPFSEVRGGRMYIPSPVSRLRSPARRSHARVPSFDYSTLGGGHTSADGRSKVFGTPQRPGPPGAFQSPAYYFSSDAYGDPNGKSTFFPLDMLG